MRVRPKRSTFNPLAVAQFNFEERLMHHYMGRAKHCHSFEVLEFWSCCDWVSAPLCNDAVDEYAAAKPWSLGTGVTTSAEGHEEY